MAYFWLSVGFEEDDLSAAVTKGVAVQAFASSDARSQLYPIRRMREPNVFHSLADWRTVGDKDENFYVLEIARCAS